MNNSQHDKSVDKNVANEPLNDIESAKIKIPPIVIRNKDSWTNLSKLFQKNYHKAVNIKEGIKIFPNDTDDFRLITKHLDTNNHSYHTYQLPDEKLLHVVLRNIPVEVKLEEIKEDLISQDFNPIEIYRMKNREKNPMPLILVKLPKNEKSIFNLKNVNGLVTTVETLRNKTGTGQCFRCQKFGHSQKRCHAEPVCVKCAKNHLTTECTQSNNTKATCANCGKDHPASYKGCTAFPKPKKIIQSKQNSVSNKTYAEIVSNNQNKVQNNTPTQPISNEVIDITSAFANLQKAVIQITQMADIFKKLIPEANNLTSKNNH